MCSSPAEATTESAPSPQQQGSAPEDAAGGGSWFDGRLRGMLIMAVVALVLSALLLTVRNRKTHSGGGSPQSLSVHSDSSRVLRLKGTTESVETPRVPPPLLAGQPAGRTPHTPVPWSGT